MIYPFANDRFSNDRLCRRVPDPGRVLGATTVRAPFRSFGPRALAPLPLARPPRRGELPLHGIVARPEAPGRGAGTGVIGWLYGGFGSGTGMVGEVPS
ncbi:hypothetical protein GCM10009828_040240 [Actinoplanes couchii]|uniref:Uncharacterized protein n=1 Tax=Actinoplanes couchii TaxID=403638 RepID=A0ABQ3XGH1_9ACTN|nr:hypothetical protein Aco03nite_059990 [Actinoplanes couchii]